MSMKGDLQHLLVNFVPLRNCIEQEGYFFEFLLQDISINVWLFEYLVAKNEY